MRELLKHREIFEQYYSAGKDRSLDKLALHCDYTARTLKNWSINFNWQQRIVERDKKIADKLSKKTDKDILEIKSKHRQIVKALIQKSFDIVNGKIVGMKLSPQSVQDIERLIKLDLLLLGQSTERVDINELSKLTDEELLEKANNLEMLIKKDNEK